MATKYERALTQAQRAFNAQVARLAAEVRRDLVVPFCRKHKLEFLSGNGDYFFYSRNEITSHIGSADPAYEDSHEVFQALDLPVHGHVNLGHYVMNVRFAKRSR